MNGVSRFSMHIVNLFKKVKEMQPYSITINNQEYIILVAMK